MPTEIDFSRGARAAPRGVDIDQLFNEQLFKHSELVEPAKVR